MSKSRQASKALTLATIAGLSAACNTTLDTSRYLSGHHMDSVSSEKDANYSFDLVSLAGTPYLLENAAVRKPNEGPWVAYKWFDDAQVRQNFDAGIASLERKTISVPIQWDADGDGKPEDQMKFAITGPYQVKAEVKPIGLSELVGVRTVTHNDLQYNIRTPNIGDERFYVGIVLTEDNKGVRDTLVVPKKGSMVETDTKTGQLTVINPGQIYIIREMPIAEYQQQRESYLVALRTQEAAERKAESLLNQMKETHGIIPAVEVPKKVEAPKPEEPKKEEVKK